MLSEIASEASASNASWYMYSYGPAQEDPLKLVHLEQKSILGVATGQVVAIDSIQINYTLIFIVLPINTLDKHVGQTPAPGCGDCWWVCAELPPQWDCKQFP